jgi:hypothetical protein
MVSSTQLDTHPSSSIGLYVTLIVQKPDRHALTDVPITICDSYQDRGHALIMNVC